jgi:hypothetical protein
VLDTLRNRFGDFDEEPRVRVDSLISMVRRIPGSEMFNVDTLKDVYDEDTTVKNLISNIKKDDSGNRYIYLSPAIGQSGDIETELDTDDAGQTGGDVDAGQGPANTVSQMSKRALGRRS